VATDGNGRYAALDPYAGAQLAYAEAYRNVCAAGAVPVAVTNCLNFGSPEDPEVMWQFAEAVRGLADACARLGTPVTGGNVSFYNQTGATAIHPTPVIGVLGLIDDVARRSTIGFRSPGDVVVLLGTTQDELGGSQWAWVTHEHLGGRPPAVDLDAERALGTALVAAAERGLVTSAHDLSDGGLAQALVESCLRHGVGARITLAADPFVALCSESTARAVVSLPPDRVAELEALCRDSRVPITRLGEVGEPGGELVVEGQFAIPVDELRATAEATLPRYFA
jgi:phosphoribosylformylglycinamidine synthase